jgi:hypothetical protein
MYLVLVSVASGLLLGALLGGRLASLGHLELRLGWVLILAVGVQLVIAFRLARDPEIALGVVGGGLIASYLAVLGVCWFNRRLPGMWIIALGVLLNLLAAVPQGGLMATTPEALADAGRPVTSALPPPGARPYVSAKDVVLPREEIPLWPLGDSLVFPRGSPLNRYFSPFSPGDLVVATGLAWLLAAGMGPRVSLALARPGEPRHSASTRSTSVR